ncbi:MAG: phosphoesterase RecJ domain-containing protein [Ruminococcaceae bacterium]|nr:phosphoesterase RecJ domain-containing protein [Oscillospiraceae bacterium]
MTRNDCAAWLLEHDNYCILTHVRPDGDTMGSAAALCVGLRQLGKNAHLLQNDGVSPFLDRCQLGLTNNWPEDGDTLVCVDVASPGMLPEDWKCLQDRIDLRIDHHGTATSFTPGELVDSSAAACGEIVYDVLMAMGCEMTKEIAWRLYIAISTDTGCFRYANTTANTYRVAAACAETGAELYPITQELFDTTSISELKLQNWMVDHAVFLCGGKAAVCAIPPELEESVSKEDLEGISGFLRSIEGVKISATIRKTETGCKMSVRAIPGFDAAAVCRKFGGGGHKGAAGASLSMSMEEAARAAAEALTEVVAG